MALYQIIERLEKGEELMYETIHPYLKSLNVYFKHHFLPAEPIVMVTIVSSAMQGVKIVSSEDFMDALDEEVQELEEDEREAAKEAISLNSAFLENLIMY